jgi:hypothetical protein
MRIPLQPWCNIAAEWPLLKSKKLNGVLQSAHSGSFRTENFRMRAAWKYFGVLGGCAVLAFAAVGAADSVTDTPDSKYDVKVPAGLAFSEFKGYESWQAISISHSDHFISLIVGNPIMIDAFRIGFPQNGKPFPEGAKMAKIHWVPKQSVKAPAATTVAGTLSNVEFMVKDSARFADSGGWGYAIFEYDAASDTYKPGTFANQPPQGHDAKCGAACHTLAKSQDYVFTEYGKR